MMGYMDNRRERIKRRPPPSPQNEFIIPTLFEYSPIIIIKAIGRGALGTTFTSSLLHKTLMINAKLFLYFKFSKKPKITIIMTH